MNPSIIAADDPVTCAAYAKENDLLGLEGWHRFRSLAKKDKVLVSIHGCGGGYCLAKWI